MKTTKEVSTVKNILSNLGRNEKINFLKNSNLTDREFSVMYSRFVRGLTISDSAEDMNVSIDAFNKIQRRAFFKIYSWLEFQAFFFGFNFDELENFNLMEELKK